jgi:hypothetical protein
MQNKIKLNLHPSEKDESKETLTSKIIWISGSFSLVFSHTKMISINTSDFPFFINLAPKT